MWHSNCSLINNQARRATTKMFGGAHMADNHRVELLKKCIAFITSRLSSDESIIQVKQGRIIPGRQVFHCSKFHVATMDSTLQNPPTRRIISVKSIRRAVTPFSRLMALANPLIIYYRETEIRQFVAGQFRIIFHYLLLGRRRNLNRKSEALFPPQP